MIVVVALHFPEMKKKTYNGTYLTYTIQVLGSTTRMS